MGTKANIAALVLFNFGLISQEIVQPGNFISGPSNNRSAHETFIEKKTEKEYLDLVKRIKTDQNEFKKLYGISTSSEKKRVIENARAYIEKTLVDELFPAWHGTPWVFGGNSRFPTIYTDKDTSIDCGHFVTRILTDAGFNIRGNYLATLPSESMIKMLVSPKDVYIYTGGKSAEFMEKEIKRLGKGFYFTGLDCHTGYIHNDGKNILFIHSSYYSDKKQVVSEPANGFNPFAHSRYRVLGKAFQDDMILKWLR